MVPPKYATDATISFSLTNLDHNILSILLFPDSNFDSLRAFDDFFSARYLQSASLCSFVAAESVSELILQKLKSRDLNFWLYSF